MITLLIYMHCFDVNKYIFIGQKSVKRNWSIEKLWSEIHPDVDLFCAISCQNCTCWPKNSALGSKNHQNRSKIADFRKFGPSLTWKISKASFESFDGKVSTLRNWRRNRNFREFRYSMEALICSTYVVLLDFFSFGYIGRN